MTFEEFWAKDGLHYQANTVWTRALEADAKAWAQKAWYAALDNQAMNPTPDTQSDVPRESE